MKAHETKPDQKSVHIATNPNSVHVTCTSGGCKAGESITKVDGELDGHGDDEARCERGKETVETIGHEETNAMVRPTSAGTSTAGKKRRIDSENQEIKKENDEVNVGNEDQTAPSGSGVAPSLGVDGADSEGSSQVRRAAPRKKRYIS
ncbi:hypothetical protein Agabi119p4_3373 [Agaricus bisporus var. burnettii]|uniref:Uncharacterized protein n=1 Tax=Agaricus bisporus var. burnettii TaxID=192524 RepID=A0A8H7F751_AGABI|nr:hypothetical protein Agabi119p4_3373 [Agaricus bisporus var. burnettii]